MRVSALGGSASNWSSSDWSVMTGAGVATGVGRGVTTGSGVGSGVGPGVTTGSGVATGVGRGVTTVSGGRCGPGVTTGAGVAIGVASGSGVGSGVGRGAGVGAGVAVARTVGTSVTAVGVAPPSERTTSGSESVVTGSVSSSSSDRVIGLRTIGTGVWRITGCRRSCVVGVAEASSDAVVVGVLGVSSASWARRAGAANQQVSATAINGSSRVGEILPVGRPMAYTPAVEWRSPVQRQSDAYPKQHPFK